MTRVQAFLIPIAFATVMDCAFAQLPKAERIRRRRSPVVEVFESCKDSVVNISTQQVVEVRSPFGFDSAFDELFDFPVRPRSRQFKTTAVGSGFVIHPSGYIATNAHVVARTAERKAIFSDQRNLDAQIVALDPELDLAILKVQSGRPLVPLKFGRSDDLLVGESVIAIGNPLGLESTVTAGVISALDRKLELNQQVVYSGLIQTDASINPGNSGGPLLNVLGELIGVNTAIRGDAQNIGFAIPVNRLAEKLPVMLDVERRYRIEVGMEVGGIERPTVSRIVPGSPAEKAGVRRGDHVLKIGAAPVEKALDFAIALVGRNADERLSVLLERDGRQLATELVLAAKPMPDGARLARDRLGLEVQPMSAALARRLGLQGATGLIVSRVHANGPADEIGVQPADIILQLGRHQPASLDDLGLLLETIKPGEPMRLALLRISNQTLYRLSAAIKPR